MHKNPVMTNSVLVAIAITLVVAPAILIWRRNRPTNWKKLGLPLEPLQETSPDGRRMIRVKGMDKQLLDKTIAAFQEYNAESGHAVTLPAITGQAGTFILTWSTSIDFETFGYWVNFLSWGEEGNIFDVTGWYDTSLVINEHPEYRLSRQTLMVYVPKWDTEADRFYFTNAKGQFFMQGLAGDCPLVVLSRTDIPFEPAPEF